MDDLYERALALVQEAKALEGRIGPKPVVPEIVIERSSRRRVIFEEYRLRRVIVEAA